MQKNRIVITVDGLAASGKSTISSLLAKKLGFAHLNSGSLYRTAALLCLRNNLQPSEQNKSDILALIKNNLIELRQLGAGDFELLLNGENVKETVQSHEVSEVTSQIAVFPEVREALYDAQRNAFPGCNLVAEGRDMGTVIFPDASIKFFITARTDVRVARRLKQISENSADAAVPDVAQLTEEIDKRDKRDSERQVAPTKPAENSITIDNSEQTLTQIIEKMYDSVAKCGLLTK